MGYVIVGKCTVCGSDQIATRRSSLGPFISIELIHGLQIEVPMHANYANCGVCGLWYQSPHLDDASLNLFYSSGVYRKTTGVELDVARQNELQRAKTDAPMIQETCGHPLSHLDIGSSCGYLLHEVGADIPVGVEPDKTNLMFPEYPIYDKIENVPGQFTIVSSIHNLEHVSNPMGMLRNMVDLLAPGGWLVVEVPSINSPGGPFRFSHISHFEPPVLKDMLYRVGMKVVRLEMTPHLFVIAQRQDPVLIANIQLMNIAEVMV